VIASRLAVVIAGVRKKRSIGGIVIRTCFAFGCLIAGFTGIGFFLGTGAAVSIGVVICGVIALEN